MAIFQGTVEQIENTNNKIKVINDTNPDSAYPTANAVVELMNNQKSKLLIPIYTIASVTSSGDFRTITCSDMEALSGSTIGKIFAVIPNSDIVFDGNDWYGPYLSTAKYYNGTDWVSVSAIQSGTLRAGSVILMWIKGGGNYTIAECYFLTLPPV